MSQCVWMLVQITWEGEFFDNLGQEDQDDEDSDNKQPSPEFEPPQ